MSSRINQLPSLCLLSFSILKLMLIHSLIAQELISQSPLPFRLSFRSHSTDHLPVLTVSYVLLKFSLLNLFGHLPVLANKLSTIQTKWSPPGPCKQPKQFVYTPRSSQFPLPSSIDHNHEFYPTSQLSTELISAQAQTNNQYQ